MEEEEEELRLLLLLNLLLFQSADMRRFRAEALKSASVLLSASRACVAAVKSRLVVPFALVDPERAEQTSAIRSLRPSVAEAAADRYDGTICEVIVGRNLPTEVPPYFCTIHCSGCSI